MPLYYYKALSKNGTIVRNRVEDVSRLSLMRKLQKNGLYPLEVMQTARRKTARSKPKKNTAEGMASIMSSAKTRNLIQNRAQSKKKGFAQKYREWSARTRGVEMKDILVFTQNFYLLKKANFNNIHALSTIIENTENPVLQEVLTDVLAGVEAGESISSTLEYYEGMFPTIYISMIKTGELSGALTETLLQAISYLEETMALNKRIKSILIPNILEFVAILLLLIVGTIFAIPMVQDVFESVGSKDELPAITQWFSNFLNDVMATWYIWVTVLGTIVGMVIWYITTPNGRYNFDYFKYKMPVFGELWFALDFMRLMNAVLLNVKSGIRIQDALENSKNTVHNLVLLSIVETAINNISIGKSWIEPFESSGLTSAMATEMLKIGMQTDLMTMLDKLMDYMKQEVDQTMAKVMKRLPTVIYSIVGVMLIFFVIVVLVPMIQVYFGTFMFSAAGF